MSKKKNKQRYVDDGHTIYNMDVEGMPHRRIASKDTVGLNKKERKAAIKAAYSFYLPKLLIVLAAFSITMLLIYLWLK